MSRYARAPASGSYAPDGTGHSDGSACGAR
jgi:hypothetical protein